MSESHYVKVWDLLIRVFHWTLVSAARRESSACHVDG